MNEYAIVSKQDVVTLINTLKQIEVKGFDSMDKLVAAVAFLNMVLNQEQAQAQPEENAEEKEAE